MRFPLSLLINTIHCFYQWLSVQLQFINEILLLLSPEALKYKNTNRVWPEPDVIINVSVSSSALSFEYLYYGFTANINVFYFFNSGIDFRCQNLKVHRCNKHHSSFRSGQHRFWHFMSMTSDKWHGQYEEKQFWHSELIIINKREWEYEIKQRKCDFRTDEHYKAFHLLLNAVLIPAHRLQLQSSWWHLLEINWCVCMVRSIWWFRYVTKQYQARQIHRVLHNSNASNCFGYTFALTQ